MLAPTVKEKIENRTMAINIELRQLCDARLQIQKMRIRLSNQIIAAEDTDNITIQHESKLEYYFVGFRAQEDKLDREIADLVKDYPIAKKLKNINGVGPILTGKLISMIDIEKANTASSLWRYCGLGVAEDGKRDRLVKGEKCKFNTNLKPVMYLIATSFLRCKNSPYKTLYYQFKEYYQLNRSDWTPMHIDLAAKRKMVKVFLAHLYMVWRKLENLPDRPLYVHEKLQHTMIYKPEDFGWQ